MSEGREPDWDDDYLVAVAHSLEWALSPRAWERFAAHDPTLTRAELSEPLATLAKGGIHVSFGDGELPRLAAANATAVARIRQTVRRMRALAPDALGGAALAVDRFLCTDPWPRIYTQAVLDFDPATTPVHVVQDSDTQGDVDRVQRLPRLHALTEVRALILFGAPGGIGGLDLGRFHALTILDLEGSRLRSLPPSISAATGLEALYLARNPLTIEALRVLRALPRLRHVGLRETGIDAAALTKLREVLPATCEVEV